MDCIYIHDNWTVKQPGSQTLSSTFLLKERANLLNPQIIIGAGAELCW